MPFVSPRAAFAALLLTASIAVIGCGGDDTSTAAQQRGPGQGGGPGFMADEKVQKCLKDAGIEMPERPQGGPPQDGQQPPQNGERPPGGMRGNSAEMKKLQAALKTCGIDMPQRPQGGPPQNGTGTTTTTAPLSGQDS